ncbi:hypothetical protein [Micromonospora sp. NPDC005206]|uniref:hypothetical protein n=1 Tax=Micromonospora sp. NPDC005206 TaxID=3157022 RepID=UPI0033B7F628
MTEWPVRFGQGADQPEVKGAVDAATVGPDTDVLTARDGQLKLVNIPARGVRPITRPLADLGYSGVPNSLLTTGALSRYGWQPARVGWLLEADHTLTEQELAAGVGLTIESRRAQASLQNLRTGATIAGALLALGVLATTVGLIRGEAAGDMRTLTAAAGASRRVRRTLTATTAGALALLGAVLGLAGAYLALVSVLHRDLAALGPVPVAHPAATTVGLPLLATAAGWLLAGRQPRSFAWRGLD